MKSNDMPIDFVIPWVDNADPVWQEQFLHYKLGNNTNSRQSSAIDSFRFRCWGTLKYWFRGVEQCAPWVNKVYFVTCGQCPDWLNVRNPKLVLVNHDEYIPLQYLPCFSSHPIEFNFHRIKQLSEHFVYFNDDVFVMNNVERDDFFLQGKPRYLIAEEPLFLRFINDDNTWWRILLNLSGVVNSKFKKREVIRKNMSLWFPIMNPRRLLNNLCMARFNYFSCFKISHVATPLLKSRMEAVWDAVPETLDSTCRHRFRSPEDVNQYIFYFWNIMTGYAKQISHFFKTDKLTLTDSSLDMVAKVLRSSKAKMICVNDTKDITDFNKAKEVIVSAFESRFPQKSSFEK